MDREYSSIHLAVVLKDAKARNTNPDLDKLHDDAAIELLALRQMRDLAWELKETLECVSGNIAQDAGYMTDGATGHLVPVQSEIDTVLIMARKAFEPAEKKTEEAPNADGN